MPVGGAARRRGERLMAAMHLQCCLDAMVAAPASPLHACLPAVAPVPQHAGGLQADQPPADQINGRPFHFCRPCGAACWRNTS